MVEEPNAYDPIASTRLEVQLGGLVPFLEMGRSSVGLECVLVDIDLEEEIVERVFDISRDVEVQATGLVFEAPLGILFDCCEKPLDMTGANAEVD